jgi:hypothetical protein
MTLDIDEAVDGVTFRALVTWPHDGTPSEARRSRFTFKASWPDTLELLRRELRLLRASNLVIGCGLREQDIRKDGWPRANAQQPLFPGVEVSFDSDVLLDPLARRGEELIRRHGSVKAAQKATHPDVGGSARDFAAVQASQERKRLVYATDVCEFWQHNVRSIALGLEALRAVDRYGISKRGQQYAGFRAALTA